MKKAFLALLVMLFLFSVSICTRESQADGSNRKVVTEEKPSVEEFQQEVQELKDHIEAVEKERDELLEVKKLQKGKRPQKTWKKLPPFKGAPTKEPKQKKVSSKKKPYTGELQESAISPDFFPKTMFFLIAGKAVGSLRVNEDDKSEYFVEFGLRLAEVGNTSLNCLVGKDAMSIFGGMELSYRVKLLEERGDLVVSGGAVFSHDENDELFAYPSLAIGYQIGAFKVKAKFIAIESDALICHLGIGARF
ncbi:MAG: hypothetical protein HQ539_02560 [Parcubacteria group bacterium]|nr:hypothetical protein [Parcubacteria group bacterium]